MVPLNEDVHVRILLSGTSSELSLNLKGRIARHDPRGLAIHFYEMDLDSFTHRKNIISLLPVAFAPFSFAGEGSGQTDPSTPSTVIIMTGRHPLPYAIRAIFSPTRPCLGTPPGHLALRPPGSPTHANCKELTSHIQQAGAMLRPARNTECARLPIANQQSFLEECQRARRRGL
jgi:hypothetical protein